MFTILVLTIYGIQSVLLSPLTIKDRIEGLMFYSPCLILAFTVDYLIIVSYE